MWIVVFFFVLCMYVSSALLLGTAILNKAYELGAEATLLFLPITAINSWRAFAESGFAVRRVADDGYGLLSEIKHPAKDTYIDFLTQQRLGKFMSERFCR